MSLILKTNPLSVPTTSAQWTNFVAREDVSNVGNGLDIRTFYLDNWDTGTALPVIKIGSIIEVGGSVYQADSDTVIGDDPSGVSDGQVRIKLVPNTASPDPTEVTPYITSDALPAWDSEKGGWYTSDDKYLPFEMTRSGAITKVYTNKFEYDGPEALVKRFASGGVYFPGAAEIGGALTVGSGASIGGALAMNGALSGVTTLSASGAVTVGSIQSGSGGYIKWKTFSGSLDVNGSVTDNHGLNIQNIISSTFVSVNSSGNSLLSDTISCSSTVFSIPANALYANGTYRGIIFYT